MESDGEPMFHFKSPAAAVQSTTYRVSINALNIDSVGCLERFVGRRASCSRLVGSYQTLRIPCLPVRLARLPLPVAGKRFSYCLSGNRDRTAEISCVWGHCQVFADYRMGFSVVPTPNLSRWSLEVISFRGTNINVPP